jgi:hypothetical protein
MEDSENWPTLTLPSNGDVVLSHNSRVRDSDLLALIDGGGNIETGKYTLRVDYGDEYDLVFKVLQ